MPQLPRNKIAKNAVIHKKSAGREANRRVAELDNICEKHKISGLTFRSCKFADSEGNVTYVDHEKIKANMKSGIMIIRANSIDLSKTDDDVYDLVKIEKEKKERDEKKKLEEMEKARVEIERLQSTNTIDNLPEGDEQHKNMLMNLMKNEDSVESLEEKYLPPTEFSNHKDNPEMDRIVNIGMEEFAKLMDKDEETLVESDTENNLTEDKKTLVESENNLTDDEEKIEESETKTNKKINKKNISSKEKKQKAIKQMQEQLQRKEQLKEGNKYFRNFMKDIRSKFVLREIPDYKYFEVKAQITDMVIDNVKTYELIMPDSIKEKYLLLLGDLQMKSGLIKQIDPSYGGDKVLQEQSDFLNRIKAKENIKTNEISEDILDKDFTDIDMLGIPEENGL